MTTQNTYKRARALHEQDIAIIADFLKDAAERHDLCSTFQKEIADLNTLISIPLDVKMTGDFKVSVSFWFDLTGVEMDDFTPDEGFLEGIYEAMKAAAGDIEGVSNVNYQEEEIEDR